MYNPDRRQEEQQCDTAAHRQIHLQNSEHRQGEQEHDTIGKVNYLWYYIIILLSVVTQ